MSHGRGNFVCQGGRNTLHQIRTNHVTQTGLDRKLPESEKANNCLSTNKGFPTNGPCKQWCPETRKWLPDS